MLIVVFDVIDLGMRAYAALSGLRCAVLGRLQQAGTANPIAGEIPIGFCNVFLMSQVTVGLVILLYKNASLRIHFEQPDADRSLLSHLLIEVDSAASMG